MKEVNAFNLPYAESIYKKWQESPSSVPAEWQNYFENTHH